eukprot:TCONS_00068692-protein
MATSRSRLGENSSANSSLLAPKTYGSYFRPENDQQAGKMTQIKSIWKKHKLLICIFLAVVIGILVGLLSNVSVQELDQPVQANVLLFVGFPGEIFTRMLKMLVLPLIITSLIIGFADLDHESSKKIGRRALLYYSFTTCMAVVLGLILVYSISPGKYGNEKQFKDDVDQTRIMDTILDLIRNMFPENIVQACLETAVTRAKEVPKHTAYNSTRNDTITNKTVLISGETTYESGTNILGIVVFSIVIGVLLGKMGSQAQTFIECTRIFNDLTMKLVEYAMWYSPIGILSLVINKFASMKDTSGEFQRLGCYLGTVISGLALHSLIVLPLAYFVMTRRNPFTFIKGTFKALLTAFATSSSSATLPVTFKCLEDNNGLDNRVTRTVLPIGATINMDGSALYEAVAAIFMAQSIGMTLDIGEYATISCVSILASIGAAGIPQGDLVTLFVVLQAVGLPEEAITLILSVDWFLDRIRTSVNVLGDCIGAGIVAHRSEGDLPQIHAPLEAFENSYHHELDDQEDEVV